MKKINNFLSEEGINKLTHLTVNEIQYNFLPNVSGQENKYTCKNITYTDNQVGLSHILYGDGHTSKHFEDFFFVIDEIKKQFDIEIQELWRMRLGIVLNKNTNAVHYPHSDFTTPHKTALLYLGKSDGDTIFYNEFYNNVKEKELTIKETNPHTNNQIVLFDGLNLHSSNPPKKNTYRVALNINFI